MTQRQEQQRQREESELLAEVRAMLAAIPLSTLSAELGPMPTHGWRNAVVRNRERSSPMDLLGWAVAPDRLEALLAVVRPILSETDRETLFKLPALTEHHQ